MNPFDQEGRNGKESYLLRRVARQRLDEALARRGTYAAALVTALIERIGERQFRETVRAAFARVEREQRRRIETALRPHTMRRRFGNARLGRGVYIAA